jgi:hypothetical protein
MQAIDVTRLFEARLYNCKYKLLKIQWHMLDLQQRASKEKTFSRSSRFKIHVFIHLQGHMSRFRLKSDKKYRKANSLSSSCWQIPFMRHELN